MPNSPFKIFYFQLCPPKCHRERQRAEMLLWRQHSKYLTGAGIVSLLHKSFNGDRRWSSSHSAHPRRLTSGATASLERQPKQKGVLPAPIAETIEVTQAFAKPAFSSYSIYRISIVDHRRQRQREGERECICACNTERDRNYLYGPKYLCNSCVGGCGIILVSCAAGDSRWPRGLDRANPSWPWLSAVRSRRSTLSLSRKLKQCGMSLV